LFVVCIFNVCPGFLLILMTATLIMRERQAGDVFIELIELLHSISTRITIDAYANNKVMHTKRA
jgi:hypothetical protein